MITQPISRLGTVLVLAALAERIATSRILLLATYRGHDLAPTVTLAVPTYAIFSIAVGT